MGNGALALPARPFGPGVTPPGGRLQGVHHTKGPSGQVLLEGFREQMARAAVQLDITGGEASGTAASVRQLEFSFVQEMRASALVAFQSRTQGVSASLPAERRSLYLEASREVAVRFSMSLSVSEVVLQAFAGASEAAAGDASGIGRLVSLNKEFMALADGLLNRLYGMLQDFLGGAGSLEERVGRFLEAFQGIELGGVFQGSNGNGVRAVGFQLEFEFMMSARTTVVVQEADPIVLDLNGNGIELTHYHEGALFDIAGKGQKVRTAFVTGGDAFLAIDRNGNGSIDDGTELFGDQRGAANGFEELRKLDTNGDGVIDAGDADFDKLLLWKDNGNGITEAGELMRLGEAGIQSINLAYVNVNQAAMGGNRLTQIASFTWSDGREGKAADAMLNYVV